MNKENMAIIGIVTVIALAFFVLLLSSGKSTPQENADLSTLGSASADDPSDEVRDSTVVEDVDELKIETLEEGDGEAAKNGDEVIVHYTGTLLDGSKFDSSLDRGEPFSFVLGEGRVIQGWEQGVVGMKIGEKRKLTIPSSLGYGEYGAGGSIPGGAGLVFEIELIDLQ